MLQSRKLLIFKQLKHGFTTKALGNLNIRQNPKAKDRFAHLVSLVKGSIVGFEQVHGAKLALITSKKQTDIIPAVDGGMTTVPGCFLTVNTADCVPVLFFDPINNVVGSIHAGWKGMIRGILSESVRVLSSMGSDPRNIIAVLGPHINSCCYIVDQDLVRLFVATFRDSRVAYKVDNAWHLDLTKAVVANLLQEGFRYEHIDYFVSCTSCQSDLFYSFRRDKSVRGEMAAFIGMR